MTDQPRITAWIHAAAIKRAKEEADDEGNNLAETGPPSQWLKAKRNGTRAVRRWSKE